MIERLNYGAKKIVPFAPAPKEEVPVEGDPAEKSGQAIVALIGEAATIANETCERAMDTAHQLSIKLRAAEDRVKELESDVKQYQVRATKAEKWLLRIHQEIEDRFFGPKVAAAVQTASVRQN